MPEARRVRECGVNIKPTHLRLTRDKPAYLRTKNAQRRASAKARGVCTSCDFNKARQNRVKCQDCADMEKFRVTTKRDGRS